MALFRVQASIITVRQAVGLFKGWRTAEQLPTFYVDADDASRATLVAARLVLIGRRSTDPITCEVAGTVSTAVRRGPSTDADYATFNLKPADVE